MISGGVKFLWEMLISLQPRAINTACCGTDELLGVIGRWKSLRGPGDQFSPSSLPASELSPAQVIFISLLNLICSCDPR